MDGKSAYELAVDEGFQGNITQWLDSLRGASGSTGTTGNQGASGSTGATGNQGATGSTGAAAVAQDSYFSQDIVPVVLPTTETAGSVAIPVIELTNIASGNYIANVSGNHYLTGSGGRPSLGGTCEFTVSDGSTNSKSTGWSQGSGSEANFAMTGTILINSTDSVLSVDCISDQPVSSPVTSDLQMTLIYVSGIQNR